ncbi:MAG: hypothetical protein JXA93_18035 [Anaerolineae bacterium]|nr:hypothetical protein [Anaerolineae bacterium]
MTRIVQVLAVPASAAGYYEDRAALDAEHVPLPQRFTAPPASPGFRALREPAEAVSVGLVLDTGGVAWGDCAAPAEGDCAPFRADDGVAALRDVVAPRLAGRQVTTLREMAGDVAALVEAIEIERPVVREKPGAEGVSRRALLTSPVRAVQAALESPTERVRVERPLHPAVRFGLGQALLRAVALARGMTPAGVVAAEWDLPAPGGPVPVHACAGHDWHDDADRMIVRRVAALPGGQVDHVEQQVGADGAELGRYLRWLAGRIKELAGEEYQPVIHVDLRGALGTTQRDHVGHMLGQLYAWQVAAAPYMLRVEDPVVKDDRAVQIKRLAELREGIRLRRLKVQIAAGAGVHTLGDVLAFIDGGAASLIHLRLPALGDLHAAVDAIRACQGAGIGVLVDGGIAGTDLSAQAAAHLALATGADLVAAGPGTGVDEGIGVVHNEMARTLALSASG